MKQRRHLLIIFLLGVFLPACSSALPASPTPLPSATILPPTAQIIPSATPTSQPIPTQTPTPTPLACWGEPGMTEAASIRSDLLREVLEFIVYLPPCYGQLTDLRYPVLYLVHGQSFRQDQWVRLGAPEVVDRLYPAGELPAFIIVMPRDRVWTQPTEDMFGQAFIKDLIPYIDSTYRTKAERDFRAVGGLSRGASWAVHLGLSRPDLFSAIGAHSLPVFWVDVNYVDDWLLDSEEQGLLPRIYVDIGDKDRDEIMNSTLWFRDLLLRLDIPHEFYLFTGYHEEAYWSAHVEQYLRFYAAGW